MSNRIAQLITDKKEHLEQIKQSLRPDLRYSSLGPTPDKIAEALPFLIETIESGIVDKQIMDGINQSSNLLYLVLGLPLQQAVPYLTSDPHFLPDNISIPNTHRETDPSALFSVLQKMTRLQRNRLLDAFPDVNTTDYLILQQALVEPNIEALKIVFEKESIDISEIQKLFGLLLDAQEFTEIIKPDLASDDVTLDVFFQFFEELFPLIANDLYESELYVESVDLMRKKQRNGHIAPETLNKWVTNLTALRLKSYWYCHDSYCENEAKIIDDYINNPYFEPFVSKCRAEFEEEERLREEESARGEIVDVDTEPVVEEVQKQAPQDNHIYKKEKYNDNASYVATNTKRIHYSVKGLSTKGAASRGNNFQWSDSLKKWYEEHTGKFEDFVRYVAKDKGYIPNEQKQVNAFIRTITGRDVPNCDEKVRLLNNGRDDATRAMLYLKKCKIISSGDYCDIFTYFDVDRPERYREKPDDNSWMSGYARDADKDFKITVIETFNDFSGLKVPKEDQNLNIATQKE